MNSRFSFSVNDDETGKINVFVMPNFITEIGLMIDEIGLYTALKQACGQSLNCCKSNKTMCSELGISLPTLIKLKKTLIEKNLIRLTPQFDENGGRLADLITMVFDSEEV